MNAETAPEEMDYCEAIAAPIGTPDKLFGTGGNDLHSDRVLVELSRFIERASVNGVSSPVDRALLDGTKQIFQTLLNICQDLAEAKRPTPSEESSIHMSIAGFGRASNSRPMLDSAGPADVDKPTRKKTKKATARKSTKKKAPGKTSTKR